ncbi:early nodulin-16-like [Vicia villosa]|uniref:early nodulin-16-like n=1 Tax=Vicia villosa TaxID=3911 RepID=UPI00273B7B26|nr:early nodulin-16-like [Vicia villosa]
MASSSLIFFMILFSVLLLISSSESTEHFVGDSERLWKDPLPSEEALFNWASNHHFTIGDTIVFKYNRRFEAVHEVTEHDYRRCITKGSRHKEFHGGNTRVVLDRLGVWYFVSGRRSHCLRGLKLAIVVMPPSPPPSLSISPPSLTVSPPSLTLPLALPASLSLSLSLSQSPSLSPSLSPSPSPNSSGGGANGHGCMVWLGVSMVMMMLLI